MVIKYSLKLEAEIQMPCVGYKKKSFAINGNNHTDVNFIEYGYGSRSQEAKAIKRHPREVQWDVHWFGPTRPDGETARDCWDNKSS